MDISLPKLNGLEATTQIKADPATRDIPVVILSALPACPHGTHGIEAGAVEVLQKPISVTDIQNVLIKYLYGIERPIESSTDSVSANRFHKPSDIIGA